MGFGTSASCYVSIGSFEGPVPELTITARHATLHHDDLLALPSMQNWHASDRASWLQRNGVHGIVGADHQRHVRLTKVIIDLVHLQHNIVGHTGLGKEDVALPRHTASHGMNGKANLDA